MVAVGMGTLWMESHPRPLSCHAGRGSALPGAQQDRAGQGLRAKAEQSLQQCLQGVLTKQKGPSHQDQDKC